METSVSVDVACDPGTAFALMSDMERFPSFFTGFGPIPRVLRCELATPPPVDIGSKRLISNADGSVLEEIVKIHKVGEEQMYRIEKGFIPPFSWMVAAAQGHWFFKSEQKGTSMTWRYRFELTSGLLKPIAGLIVHVFFKRAMKRCLDNMRAASEG